MAGLQTEPVAPGIERLLFDDVGHKLNQVDDFAIGPDGRVWMARKSDRVIELGVPGSYREEDGLPPAVELVSADQSGYPLVSGVSERGFVWAIPDGEKWGSQLVGAMPHGRFSSSVKRIATTPDGRVWLVMPEGHVRVFDGDDAYDVAPESMGVTWPAEVEATLAKITSLELASDGSVWATISSGSGAERSTGTHIARYGNRGWELLETPEAPFGPTAAEVGVGRLRAGVDGAVWAPLTVLDDGGDFAIARWDGSKWSVTAAPSCWEWEACPVAIDAHGTFWQLSNQKLYSYDGSDWTIHEVQLPGVWPQRLVAAPDGSLWLHLDREVYTIDPARLGLEGGDA